MKNDIITDDQVTFLRKKKDTVRVIGNFVSFLGNNWNDCIFDHGSPWQEKRDRIHVLMRIRLWVLRS